MRQELDAPRGVHNVGNTCFMNALVQCCRRLVPKVPPTCCHLQNNAHWPACSSQRPRAQTKSVSGHAGPSCRSARSVTHARCWKCVFDPTSPLHSSCPVGECYGVVFRNLTIFSQERHVFCNHCAYTHSETQTQCFMRVEPQINAETSISQCLQDTDIPEFK